MVPEIKKDKRRKKRNQGELRKTHRKGKTKRREKERERLNICIQIFVLL